MKILLTYPLELETKVLDAMQKEKAKSQEVARKMDKSLKAKLLRVRIKDFHFNASFDYVLYLDKHVIVVDMPLGFVEDWANPIKVVKTFQEELDKEFKGQVKARLYEGQTEQTI